MGGAVWGGGLEGGHFVLGWGVLVSSICGGGGGEGGGDNRRCFEGVG